MRDTLAAVEAISSAGGDAVVMTYWNPVLRYGVDAFARDLAAAGGRGLITPISSRTRPTGGWRHPTSIGWIASSS